MHRSRSLLASAALAAAALAAPPALAQAAATTATTSSSVPTAADARRAAADLSTYCTYAAASTGIRSEHPRWYASLCQGASTQAEAAALRTCYTAVAAGRAVSSTCLSDVRSGAVWARLDAVESGAATSTATLPRWHRVPAGTFHRVVLAHRAPR